MAHRVSGKFIDGVYIVNLHIDDQAVRRFLTIYPSVAAAAAYLLEKAAYPERLADRWGVGELGAGVSLDREVSETATFGDLLVAQAESDQGASGV